MISVSGIRGIIGQSMTPEIAGQFAAAFGRYVGGGPVILGRDSRPSGPTIRDAVVAMLTRCGCSVIDLGVVTTPGTAIMVPRHDAAGGLVITASHNPRQWNGLKFLLRGGLPPPLEEARKIWAIRDAGSFDFVRPAQRGRLAEDNTTHDRHIGMVLAVVDHEKIVQHRFKVALDSVNGAGCMVGKMLLQALGCDVVHLNGEPTGDFAHPPEPLADNLTDLCRLAPQAGADIGFAQDADADRLAIVDEQGTYIGEEYTLALAAKHMFAHRPGPAATNLSTSRMIDDLAEQAGPPCMVHRTAVGEANVVAAMNKHSCVLAGEGSGGVIDPRVVPVRDSLVAMAVVLQLLAEHDQPLSEIVSAMPRYAMIKHKFACSENNIDHVLAAVRSQFADQRISDVDGIRIDWPEGWVHVRASNTEPVIRIIAEATDRPTAESLANRIRSIADPIVK